MNLKQYIYICMYVYMYDIEYSGRVLLHIASYGPISSIQMLTPAADQRVPAQGKVAQLNLSRLRDYEFGLVASTITPSFLLFSNCCPSIATLCPPAINLVYCSTMYCYSCPRMSQGCMIAHACWIGMISSCYCSSLDVRPGTGRHRQPAPAGHRHRLPITGVVTSTSLKYMKRKPLGTISSNGLTMLRDHLMTKKYHLSPKYSEMEDNEPIRTYHCQHWHITDSKSDSPTDYSPPQHPHKRQGLQRRDPLET